MRVKAKRLAEALQDAEIAVLNVLKVTKSADVDELAKRTKLGKDAVARACLWLENKVLVSVKETKFTLIALGNLGLQTIKKKLPERRALNALIRPMSFNELAKAGELGPTELKFALGYLKKKGCVVLDKGKIKITSTGTAYKKRKTLEETFLERLSKAEELQLETLSPEQHVAFEALKKRGLTRQWEKKIREYSITPLGRKVAEKVKAEARIGMLTPSLIKSGKWRESTFRRYDIEAPVPRIYRGKKQVYKAFIDEVKTELIAMGFEEMTGSLVESTFFNNEALYMPQDHPARGIHGVYFVKQPKYGNLKKYQKDVAAVKKVHEKGGFGSTGWQIPFSKKETTRLVLRSQGTALSARMLMDPKVKIPGKYFAIARVYRPDKIDATHLTEFNQMEGIVLGKDVNFRQLLGLLADFAKKVARTDKIKFTPIAYFPFTEPSVTAYMKHPVTKKWIEVMPAGVFRPEVTKPLGINVPVLAWGFGFDRLFMIRERITDIRWLFSSDISWLREVKV